MRVNFKRKRVIFARLCVNLTRNLLLCRINEVYFRAEVVKSRVLSIIFALARYTYEYLSQQGLQLNCI
jgi:hypothetical protein